MNTTPGTSTGFVPVAPNPYIVGNPVRDRAVFFGREAEFELVRKRFHGQTHGGLLVFCGERRSGKTSILFQIVDGRLGPEFIPVLVDMQSMAITGEADFLGKIADEVVAAIGEAGITRPSFAEGEKHAARFRDFIADVLRKHPSRKLILLFDEYELFENKIDSGVLSADVLNILSNLMEHLSVFLVFTGSRPLEERRRDFWKILGKSLYKRISYLDREDALNLIRKPVEGRITYRPGTVDLIYRLTAGQAFYTQAVCQNLVDHLNETRTNEVTPEHVSLVVARMVENPLPQMLFLWDSLEAHDKLVLALLAECIADPTTHAPDAKLLRIIRRRGYPLALEQGHVAISLEKLFNAEFLLKDDATDPPSYAFRMDLWRLWIRRMHSVWQVMRELGMPIRPKSAWTRARLPVLVGLGSVLAAVILVRALMPRPGGGGGEPPIPPAWLELVAVPAEASIFMDGQQVAIGSYRGRVEGGHAHEFRVSATGWTDSVLSTRVEAGDSSSLAVSLRPQLGTLRVETNPAGADITVDGVRRGRSPVTIEGLAAPVAHVIQATLAGRPGIQRDVRVDPAQPALLRLDIPIMMADLYVTTEPSGAHVSVQGAEKGVSPVHLRGLNHGRTSFGLRHEGFQPRDTTLDVNETTAALHVVLREEPPGTLIVQGALPARIFIDNDLVGDDVPNSRTRVRSGTHRVHVLLAGDVVVDSSFVVRSGERVTFDFTSRTVARSHE